MEETNVLTPEAPEEKKRPGGGKRALQICLAVVLLAGAVCFAVMGIGELTGGQEAGEEPAFFDATAFSPDRQYLEFNMLTDPVATFTLGENHGIYLAFYADDTGIYPYLVCLSQQDFERYQDIYEFTFDDRDINESNPGRSSIAYILRNFGSIMESLDLWRSFWGDLVIGLILALVAGISPLVSAFKAHKKQSETV